jgi:hypothetical protein
MKVMIIVGAVLALPFNNLYAQDNSGGRRSSVAERIMSSKTPAAIQKQAATLGDKLHTPAKEKTTLTGQLIDGQGRSFIAKVIVQPGFLRLEGFRSGGAALSFDGERPSRTNTRDDEAILETFAMDTAEGMLESLQKGASASIQGLNVIEKATGRFYDIVEVVGPVRTSFDAPLRYKLYFFDSKTGLLARTQYLNSSQNSNVQVRFSDWRVIDGSSYPGRIERLENGIASFSFAANEIVASPRGEAAEFR